MCKSFLSWLCLAALATPAYPASVLVLPFHNNSQFPDLAWVGESIADTVTNEFAAANEIVYDRPTRADVLRRLSLRPDGDYTKATLIRLGETLDADYVCFGFFDTTLPKPGAAAKDSVLRISAQFIDLRKLHDGPDFSETGNIAELWRLEEHLAYESLHYLQPKAELKVEQFLAPEKAVRVDAEESYVRGLLSASREQKQKWFVQAAALDPKFAGPAFELGKLNLEQKQFAAAMNWFRKVPANDPRFAETRFEIGLAAYGSGDYAGAVEAFREVARAFPLSEVYNNLGAAESASNQPAASADLRKALESDPSNVTYLYNLGLALLKVGDYDGAAQQFRLVLGHDPNDADASALLDRALQRQAFAPAAKQPAPRLKSSFNATAFRQLKAMIQPPASR